MASKLKQIKNYLKKSKNKPVSQAETDHLLSKKQKKTKGKKSKDGLMKAAVETLQVAIFNIPPKKTPVINEPSAEPLKSAEQNITELLDKGQYVEACHCIFDLEQNDEEKNVDSLYNNVVTKMQWTVGEALRGNETPSAELKSVTACVKWAKEKRCGQGLGWSPKMWDKELETLLVTNIKEHIPTFVYDTKAERRSLQNHLEELESTTLQRVSLNRTRLGDLFALYLKCAHACILSHLTSLAHHDFTYKECVLLYRWGCTEYKRQLAEHVFMYQQELETLDPLIYSTWIKDSGEKIICSGEKTLGKALRETLQQEIVWLAYPEAEQTCYFHEILQKVTEITQAAEDLGDILRKVQVLCWDQLFHFVSRYLDYLQSKMTKNDAGNGDNIALRIVKNCQILRTTLEKLKLGQISGEKQKILQLICQSEAHGLQLLLNALKSTLKEALQNYFTKNGREFENALERLQRHLEDAEVKNNEALVRTIHHAVVVLYIQAFFKYSKKKSLLSTSEIFSKGSTKLQKIFVGLVADTVQLENPMEYISQILNGTDTESMKTTTVYFCNDHLDLREEHLTAIMDIKGTVSWQERKELLYYLKNRKADVLENKMCFFEEIEVKHGVGKWCCGCL
ncbi:exocyst complex component 3-like [Ascaphus truei]|uniref:exocyst complex component 3-like n=1 Tax=Ascaphus truei TaxID=8439 RepID=UPI003F596DF5